jgi:ribosomal protein S18 acetylase RimI-like enzyme
MASMKSEYSCNQLTFAPSLCSNLQMPSSEIRAVAENLICALRFFGYARGTGEIRDLPGLSLITCGLNYAAFNAALLSEPIESDARELSKLIQVSAGQFGARNLRWTCWICEDFLGKPLRREAGQIFSRHGLRPLTEAPGMYAERLRPPHRALPSLEVRPTTDDSTRAAFAEIMSLGFDIPYAVCTAVYASELAWKSALQGFVGYVDGRAVTTAATAITGDVIGVYSVATLPQYRRMGFAESIMRHVIGQATQNTGVEATVLQTTRSGISLYEKMGYRKVTNFSVYIAD